MSRVAAGSRGETQREMQATHISKVGRPSAEEAERKHYAMLEAALEEFARAGFHGASVRAIAGRAGVSTRTLYNRYPDKVALFEACLELMSREVEAQVVDHAEGTLRQRLADFAVKMQIHLSSERSSQITRLINREGAAFPILQRIARDQFYRHQVEPVAKILTDNGFSPDSARELASQFVVLAYAKWQRWIAFGEPPLTEADMEEQAKMAIALFLDGAAGMAAKGMRKA